MLVSSDAAPAPDAQQSSSGAAAATSAEDNERAVFAAAARTLAVRYTVLMPKFKAIAFLQPEDHVSTKRIRHDLHSGSRSGQLFVSIAHHASIFASGAALFLAQEFALKRIEPESKGDFSKATPLSTAISGGVGGALYSLCATSTAAYFGTSGKSLILSPEKRLHSSAFLRAALPYTLPRDAGGFALYFGAYSLAQSTARQCLPAETSDAAPSSSGVGGVGSGVGGGGGISGPHAATVESTTTKLHLLTNSPGELLRGVAIAAASGGVAGLATYCWRSPLDTLYKRSVGWRAADAPLWSFSRFLSSPRGVKAVAIGAVTWSVYEVADACLRALAGA